MYMMWHSIYSLGYKHNGYKCYKKSSDIFFEWIFKWASIQYRYGMLNYFLSVFYLTTFMLLFCWPEPKSLHGSHEQRSKSVIDALNRSFVNENSKTNGSLANVFLSNKNASTNNLDPNGLVFVENKDDDPTSVVADSSKR